MRAERRAQAERRFKAEGVPGTMRREPCAGEAAREAGQEESPGYLVSVAKTMTLLR
jgi:hypothetical protein